MSWLGGDQLSSSAGHRVAGDLKVCRASPQARGTTCSLNLVQDWARWRRDGPDVHRKWSPRSPSSARSSLISGRCGLSPKAPSRPTIRLPQRPSDRALSTDGGKSPVGAVGWSNTPRAEGCRVPRRRGIRGGPRRTEAAVGLRLSRPRSGHGPAGTSPRISSSSSRVGRILAPSMNACAAGDALVACSVSPGSERDRSRRPIPAPYRVPWAATTTRKPSWVSLRARPVYGATSPRLPARDHDGGHGAVAFSKISTSTSPWPMTS